VATARKRPKSKAKTAARKSGTRNKTLAKKTSKKKASAKKTAKKAAKKAVKKKAARKKAPAKKTAARKAPAKKATKKAAKKATPKKATKKAPAKKAVKKTAKKAAKKKAPAKKTAARKAPAKKAGAKKAGAKKAARVLRAGGSRASAIDPPQAPKSEGSKRSFGLRGAAPWVARHAAKHAEELRKRNAEPPPPGSARATLRVPPEAERIKSDVAALHQQTSKIRQLRKRLDKNFYEIGEMLAHIQLSELHEAKGYSTFESFLDREIDLGRSTSLRLIRIAHTFLRETAYDYGLERLSAALAALDGELSSAPSHPSSVTFSSPFLPPKPPSRSGRG
jgi:hypothetical protein